MMSMSFYRLHYLIIMTIIYNQVNSSVRIHRCLKNYKRQIIACLAVPVHTLSLQLFQQQRSLIFLSNYVLLDFSLTVKAVTLIFISGRGSAISSAKEGKSGFIYNLVKSL